MKLRYLLLTLIFAVIVVFAVFFGRHQLETFYYKANEAFRQPGEENLTQPKFPQPPGGSKTNYTGTTLPEGIPGGLPGQQEPEQETAPKALTLGITDICSGKMEGVLATSEGMRYCLNEGYPYYIILEKNSTHLQTSFYNTAGFNDTYELDESALIYFLFAEDVASISQVIESFYIEGSSDFYLGDYDLHTIWERDASGNLSVSKMIAILPLYVKSSVTATNEWDELKFYLNIPDKNYSLGNLWVLVKEK